MKPTMTQNKQAGKGRRWLLTTLLALLVSPCWLSAQITIGDGTEPKAFSILEIISNQKRGLRMPHLTTDERDEMTTDKFGNETTTLAKGLTIYNTSIDCVEYWNSSKWISLCSGNSAFTGGECADTPVAPTGGSVSCSVTDPNCETAGEYTFTFVSGSDFASIEVTDAGAGTFTVSFDDNDQASDRQVIIMVTSPCGANSMLVFTQTGDSTGCGVTTVPAIKSVDNVTAMCSGGAVYLYLEGYPTAGTFIWTLNGQQVGSGYNYTATVPGKYIVYGDKVGCTNSQSFQVTLDGTGAPNPVQLIVIGNNGEACGTGGTVELVASTPSSGTVIWFCDGQLTNKTGTNIDAGKGYWTARASRHLRRE